MTTYKAHALNDEELALFSGVYSLPDFSIAEYKYKENTKPLSPFQHKHEEYEFILPKKTLISFLYENSSYVGEVSYVYPVMPYTDHGTDKALINSEVISIAVNKYLFDSLAKTLGYENLKLYSKFHTTTTLNRKIAEYINEYKNENHDLIKLNDIKNIIVIALIEEASKNTEDHRHVNVNYNAIIKHSLDKMFECYKDPEFSINYLANESGYSVAYFTKAFKKCLCDTPINFLNKLRISEAKSLFENKDLSLEDVAKLSGYQNQSSFTEAFKRIANMTPLIYRKLYYNK